MRSPVPIPQLSTTTLDTPSTQSELSQQSLTLRDVQIPVRRTGPVVFAAVTPAPAPSFQRSLSAASAALQPRLRHWRRSRGQGGLGGQLRGHRGALPARPKRDAPGGRVRHLDGCAARGCRRSHSAASTRRAPLAAPRRARRRGVGHRVVDRMGGRGEGHERPRTGTCRASRRHRRRCPRQHRLLRRLRAVPGPLPWHPVGRSRRRSSGHRRRRRRRDGVAGGLRRRRPRPGGRRRRRWLPRGDGRARTPSTSGCSDAGARGGSSPRS